MPGILVEELCSDVPPALVAQEHATTPVERPFGLHMAASYILECSVELSEITPMEEMVFRVKNPASLDFIRRTDRDELLPPHWLRNTARQYLDSLLSAPLATLVGLQRMAPSTQAAPARIAADLAWTSPAAPQNGVAPAMPVPSGCAKRKARRNAGFELFA